MFDRIEIVQGEQDDSLARRRSLPDRALRAAGAPELREIGLFRIARASGFDATAPFRLDLTSRARPAARGRPRRSSSLDYRIPDRYLHPRPLAAPAADCAVDGRAVRGDTRPAQAPLWQDIWWARVEIAVLALMLAGLGVILIFQNAVDRARRASIAGCAPAICSLTFVFLGLIANAQLSVVNVITFVHALLSGFRWELFLLDPMVFMLWSFVAVSMLFWGRGVFCGWLCPFGALQELLNKLARRLGVKQIEIPFGLHERLWMIKYVIFPRHPGDVAALDHGRLRARRRSSRSRPRSR